MTPADRTARIDQYRRDLAGAKNESVRRELLHGLLNALFGGDARAAAVLREMSLGAETALKIPLPDRVQTGFAETQYGTVILEYKNDLAGAGRAVEEQLAKYVLGNWHAGERYRFTLVATDGAAWRALAPRAGQLAAGVSDPAELEMTTREEFALTAGNGDEFYYFLDRRLFAIEPVRPTLERIEREFGATGPAFVTVLTALRRRFRRLRRRPGARPRTGRRRGAVAAVPVDRLRRVRPRAGRLPGVCVCLVRMSPCAGGNLPSAAQSVRASCRFGAVGSRRAGMPAELFA